MSVIKGQERLKKIANTLSADTSLDKSDKEFLVTALYEIADGQNAEDALNIKAKRGERRSKFHKSRKYNDTFMYGLIATAILPESDGGLGMTLKDAVTMVKKEFPNLPDEASIRRMWNNIKDSNPRDFYTKPD